MNRATVAALAVVVLLCYGGGVMYFYSSAATWEGAEQKEDGEVMAMKSQLQVLEAERAVQKKTIDELSKELKQTRAEALQEMEQIDAALKLAHVDRDRLNVLKAGGAPKRDGDASPLPPTARPSCCP